MIKLIRNLWRRFKKFINYEQPQNILIINPRNQKYRSVISPGDEHFDNYHLEYRDPYGNLCGTSPYQVRSYHKGHNIFLCNSSNPGPNHGCLPSKNPSYGCGAPYYDYWGQTGLYQGLPEYQPNSSLTRFL